MNTLGNTLIDKEIGLSAYGGDNDLYHQNLASIEAMTISPSIYKIHTFWKDLKFEELSKESLKVKGAAL